MSHLKVLLSHFSVCISCDIVINENLVLRVSSFHFYSFKTWTSFSSSCAGENSCL